MPVASACNLDDAVEGTEVADDPFEIQIHPCFDDLGGHKKTG
jgi:hypothetical protein